MILDHHVTVPGVGAIGTGIIAWLPTLTLLMQCTAAGISIILGLIALIAWWKARKALRLGARSPVDSRDSLPAQSTGSDSEKK